MQLSIGFSPCPNDTFIFDALLHGKIDTEGLSFKPVIEDVEALNQMAFQQELHITKLSYHAFAHLLPHYALLNAGSALGEKVGPLLIAKTPMEEGEINKAHIAIPGQYTTANFLLSLAFPQAQTRSEMLFSDIEQAVLEGRADAGLIIHENRFTYQDKGLIKLMDLGDYWESTSGLPIPLGGIVVRRDLPSAVQQKVDRVLARSVAHALDHPDSPKAFVRQYAQEMEEAVMYKHIHLYVNDYTRDLGERGRAAIHHLFNVAMDKGVMPATDVPIFV
ncbi:MAG: 1,4-dihydroxy-6-naphthoate synthase [Phaeodactylibacter sp.]|uniref:menaquinone biosynthesis family protein n=1 Tax=Phaeodactylibacter sp. TaxID=1940289 RepID=UPI0032F092F1